MLPLLVVIVAAFSLIEARPGQLRQIQFSRMIVGGSDAEEGEFPWQLSQQRQGTIWNHSCGASLLSANRALSAAHCVDGASASILRVIAGLHRRANTEGTQTSNVASYVMHPEYNQGTATFANDIAILNLVTAVVEGTGVQFALLATGSNDLAGTTCVISGWGRTSSSQILPNILQKASINVISGAECQSLVDGIGVIWDGHICLHDPSGAIGSCNGDSGGPLNCPSADGTIVAGVTSWGISSNGVCSQVYPSVYTRTSYYDSWINSNL